MNTARKLLLVSSLAIAINAISNIDTANAASLDQAYDLYLAGDIQGSEREYAMAVEELDNNPDKLRLIAEFDYKRAAWLINKGDYTQAINILEVYVFADNANVRMQSDYLDALSRLGKYRDVPNAAQRFWHNDYQNVPKYGMMLVADSHFKLKQYAAAESIYRQVLARDPNHLYANLSLAYCLTVANQQQAALLLYEKCYTLATDAESLLLSEAETLFAEGKRHLANTLYDFLANKSGSQTNIKLSKARALASVGSTISSEKILASIPMSERNTSYFEQKFNNSISSELYQNAATYLHKLETSPRYAVLLKRYEQARRGGMDTAFMTTSNYKGNTIQTYSVEADSYIGANSYLTAAIDSTRLSDHVHLATVTTSTLGLVHRFERGKVNVAVANAVSGSAHTLYKAGVSFKLDDSTNIGFDVGKRYIGDSKAVLYDFITEQYYSLSLSHRLNSKNAFFADYTSSSLSDSNHTYGYSFSYSYYPIRNNSKTHELYTYYKRSGFSKLSPYYESPDKRIAYGLGWQARWVQTSGSYWTVRLNLELGHDNLEPTDLSPNIRVQYTLPIGKHKELSFASEYGIRTNRLNNISHFLHGYKQFEVKYNMSW